jgi:hypothetical protein
MRARVAVFVASLAAAPISWPAAADGLPQLRTSPSREPGPTVPDLTSRVPGVAPQPAWDTFSADLTIRRRLLRRDGTVGLEGPEVRYRWARTLTERGWKTAMTLVSASPDTVQTDKGPKSVSRKIPVSRIEIGDPRTPTRVFDAEGRMVFLLPSQAPRSDAVAESRVSPGGTSIAEGLAAALAMPASTAAVDVPADAMQGREWIEQLMPTRTAGAARRAALVRALGNPHGVERGLDRFIGHANGETTEVLSDPAWGVPVEINVVRDGALTSHTTFGYVEDPGAGLVRRRLRSEHLLSPESGDRSVVDVELTNIRLDRGGAR